MTGKPWGFGILLDELRSADKLDFSRVSLDGQRAQPPGGRTRGPTPRTEVS